MEKDLSPPKRPPTLPSTVKHKPSTLPKPSKFNLTPVQRVLVKIIDCKRCSVRCLLLISYVTLLHLLIYLVIFGYGYSLITKSNMLMVAFYGFFVDLGLYFFGSGAALKAITYVWQPLKFSLGIISIVIGIIWNVCLYFVGFGTYRSDIDAILPVNLSTSACELKNRNATDEVTLCSHKKPVRIALTCIPFILPPVSIICVIFACLSAYKAIYVVPKKVKRGEVDAVWLEPYETYDFYVGKNIPKIPGYDDPTEEGHEHFHVNEYFAEESEGTGDDSDTKSIKSIKSVSSGRNRKSVVSSIMSSDSESTLGMGRQGSIAEENRGRMRRKMRQSKKINR